MRQFYGYMTHKIDRCFANRENQELYAYYHDTEWGIPVHDDRALFEMLCLEAAQAGLSFEIVLKKRAAYQELFYEFDPSKVSLMKDEELDDLACNPRIIRHRKKIYAFRSNALVFLKMQQEFGTFDHYLWAHVNFQPVKGHYEVFSEVPSSSSLSDKISKDLKKRGMIFVGTKIIYSFLQAVGVLNDHAKTCFLSK